MAPLSSVESADNPSLNLDALAPDSATIENAARDAIRQKCRTPACTAVIRLDHILDIILDGDATTMGVTYYLSPNQKYVEERRLHAVLLDHPKRFAPMCALLTSLASRYGLSETDNDPMIGVEAVDLALRMDGHGPPRCLPAVLAAMPHTAAADTAIDSAKTGCEYEPVARNPCARIVRPAKP